MQNMFVLTLIILLSSASVAGSDDLRDEVTGSWKMMQQGARERYSDAKKRNEERSDSVKSSWEAENQEVLRKWGVLVSSTRRRWVSYSPYLDSRAEVDFDEGFLRLSIVIPEDGRHVDAYRDRVMRDHLRELLSCNRLVNRNVLEDQIRDRYGERVHTGSVDRYYEEEIKPRISCSRTSARPGATIARADVRLIPDHLDVRARKYRETVKAVAGKYGIEPELIMAIIHTESFFNPLAVSPRGACGLMQLMPDHGGKEAYAFVYGTSSPVPADAFFNPEMNIELGAAYLHLLRTNHFGWLDDPEKKLYMTICAYNWGPGAVNRNVCNRMDVEAVSRQVLYSALCSRAPAETSDYLQKVTLRMDLYRTYF